MKILFVCTGNLHRSKTAHDYFAKNYPELSFQSAGTNEKICTKHGSQLLNEDLLMWADHVLVMEGKHKQLISSQNKKKYDNKIHILWIQDYYQYFQLELLELLDTKFTAWREMA